MKTLENRNNFIDGLAAYNDRIAIIWDEGEYSFGFLSNKVEKWRHKLASIKSGTIVGIEGDFSPESISILLALMGMQVIIVPLYIKHKDKNQKKYQIAQIEKLIRINEKDKVDILDLDSAPKLNILYKNLIKNNRSGLVLFTSGSSGEPKAAVHEFEKLLNKFDSKRNALKTINFLLFDHWGGLNTLFHILSNGGTVITLQDRNPDYVCKIIEKYKAELLPVSPSFLNFLLLGRAHERWDLGSLKVISYGAEPMPQSLLDHLHRAFPRIKLVQTYGLIELGVLRSKSESNDSLWVKIGGDGYEIRIVDGIIQIKSDSAMLGYINAKSPFTDDGWFITGDMVEVKGDYYRILGRKSEIINVGGEKVFPQEVENLLLEVENVLDARVFGDKNPLTGNIVCADIVLEKTEDLTEARKRIKIHCRSKLESFKVPVKISFQDKQLFNDRFKKKRVQ